MIMTKQNKKVTHRTVHFEPGRVVVMVAVVSALTLVFFGMLTAL